jgi:hypothetical protein
MAKIPLADILLAWRKRLWFVDAGGVWLARVNSGGGWKGPEGVAAVCEELALRALAFSSLSALKKMSNGDSSR